MNEEILELKVESTDLKNEVYTWIQVLRTENEKLRAEVNRLTAKDGTVRYINSV